MHNYPILEWHHSHENYHGNRLIRQFAKVAWDQALRWARNVESRHRPPISEFSLGSWSGLWALKVWTQHFGLLLPASEFCQGWRSCVEWAQASVARRLRSKNASDLPGCYSFFFAVWFFQKKTIVKVFAMQTIVLYLYYYCLDTPLLDCL